MVRTEWSEKRHLRQVPQSVVVAWFRMPLRILLEVSPPEWLGRSTEIVSTGARSSRTTRGLPSNQRWAEGVEGVFGA